ARDAKLGGANLAEGFVALRRNPREVLLAGGVLDPVVAGKRGASLKQRRLAVDDGGVLHAGASGGFNVPRDESRIRHGRLKRQISAAVLRIAARVGLEKVGVDAAHRLNSAADCASRGGV